MCELFGLCLRKKVEVNKQLKEFFSHSVKHPHGWGMAMFYKDAVSIEKEPITAIKSNYLKERLHHKIKADNMLAHIRLATMGAMDYENCHPFVRSDCFGTRWTLIHNGTIFEGDKLEKYRNVQEGKTDSERILYYFISEIDNKQEQLGRKLDGIEKFELLDKLIVDIASGNKLNLIFYDGKYMYVHTNFKESLYYLKSNEGVMFSTTPLSEGEWELVPFKRLNVYYCGDKVYEGAEHNCEYIYNEKDYRYLMMESALL